MAKIKKKVKKYIKKNEPTYKGLDKEKKKLVKARFEERVERYRKDLEAAKKKKRRKHPDRIHNNPLEIRNRL